MRQLLATSKTFTLGEYKKAITIIRLHIVYSVIGFKTKIIPFFCCHFILLLQLITIAAQHEKVQKNISVIKKELLCFRILSYS